MWISKFGSVPAKTSRRLRSVDNHELFPPFSLALVLAFLFPSCGNPVEGVDRDDRRVVLTVVLDALHSGHVHHLGYPRETTPHIDALAAEGVTFTRAAAPAPYTVASTVSLMTGLLPHRHGVMQRYGKGTRPMGTTLAEELSRHGWQCFGATSNANAGELTGIAQGFQQWLEAYEGTGTPDEPSITGEDGTSIHLVSADWWPGQLERVLDQADPERDTFIYFHLLQPHSPYFPPDEIRAKFTDPEYVSSWSDSDTPEGFAAGEVAPLVRANEGLLEMTAADRQHTLDLYDASIFWADRAIGQMVDVLKERGLWDSTWMVVTSDHGEAFWQHGRWGHNDHLYEEMLRVPLVARAPTGLLPAGVRCDRLVSPMDLLPTVLDWAHLPPVESIDGVSLDKTLHQEGPDSRGLLFVSNSEQPFSGAVGPCTKIIFQTNEDGSVRIEQYHLPDDPGERVNQAGAPPPAALPGAVADRTTETFGQECTIERHDIGEVRMRALFKLQEILARWIEADRVRFGSVLSIQRPLDLLVPLDEPRRLSGQGTHGLLDALGYTSAAGGN